MLRIFGKNLKSLEIDISEAFCTKEMLSTRVWITRRKIIKNLIFQGDRVLITLEIGYKNCVGRLRKQHESCSEKRYDLRQFILKNGKYSVANNLNFILDFGI